MKRTFIVYYEANVYETNYGNRGKHGTPKIVGVEKHKVYARNAGDVEAIISDLRLFESTSTLKTPIILDSIKVYNNTGKDVTEYFIYKGGKK